MTTVWKTIVPPHWPDVRPLTVRVPFRARPLHVAEQGESDLAIWWDVLPNAPLEPRKVFVIGTGWAVDTAGCAYLGTIIDGSFVWHVFVEATV